MPLHLQSSCWNHLNSNICTDLCSWPLPHQCSAAAAMQGSTSAFIMMGQHVQSLLVCLIKMKETASYWDLFPIPPKRRHVKKKKNPALLSFFLFQRILLAAFQHWIFLFNSARILQRHGHNYARLKPDESWCSYRLGSIKVERSWILQFKCFICVLVSFRQKQGSCCM